MLQQVSRPFPVAPSIWATACCVLLGSSCCWQLLTITQDLASRRTSHPCKQLGCAVANGLAPWLQLYALRYVTSCTPNGGAGTL